ncbi:wax ester/triacylglycerol synthase family O-acyltransferase [Zavarzinia compransoris]|uniref:WS/DGAT/MGAT family O-acyltransferase n=1 Tax=Zavarzinia marina TaxID=2911065 RepID=UPI001F1A011C|nr:wax ester/triacylglycerol synthase family O-acyltransferase [Zavarzinia marina]MCF4166423.1 wax ester/triacylglycerol synthase family O-acyltransferase [Zavarzinia marina]
MQQLSGLDQGFLALETPNSPMHIAGLCFYDPSTAAEPFSFERIRQGIEDRLHLARTFRQRLVEVPMSLDRAYWIEDPDFDLDYHLRHVAVPSPGDWHSLMTMAARIASYPLDRSRPLWEFYVIEGLDNVDWLPKGSFATLVKIHHAAIDGVSSNDILFALTDLTPEGRNIEPPRKRWVPERLPGAGELLVRTALTTAVAPFKLFEGGARLASSLIGSVARLPKYREDPPPAPFQAPRTPLNVPVSAQRVWDGAIFPLDTVKRIRKAVEGATVNDVVLAVCAGALRRWLDKHHSLPDRSLIAFAPISVRNEKEKGALGNQVSGMLVSIATDIADPMERLAAVRRNTEKSKSFINAVGARALTDYTRFVPSATAAMATRLYTRMKAAESHSPIFNCVITNVPGPQIPLYTLGNRLEAQIGFGPIFDGMGLLLAIFSYDGTISIGVSSCRRIMPDVADFVRFLEDSLNDLAAAADAVPGKDAPAAEKAEAPAPRKKAPRRRAGAIPPVESAVG